MIVSLVCVIGACSTDRNTSTAAGSPGTRDPKAPILALDDTAAAKLNGTIPTADAANACGSSRATFLAELLSGDPLKAKVQDHWGLIVKPGSTKGEATTGVEMTASGTIVDGGLGNGDTPFDHPYGADLSFDLRLDAPYLRLSQTLGAGHQEGGADNAQGQSHDEIEAGLVPARPGTATAAVNAPDWVQAATAIRDGVDADFLPKAGDRAVVMGRWVIDCGHGDYNAELHPITFAAFARTEGKATTVHFWANPYRITQRYHSNATLSGEVNDSSRLSSPDAKPFLGYFVSEIGEVGKGERTRLDAPMLLDANRLAPAPFRVCAPTGNGTVQIHAVTRSGVTITTKQVDGCVQVVVGRSAKEQPADATTRLCPMPWNWLNDEGASQAGVSGLRIQDLLKKFVPADKAAVVDADPLTICAAPLERPVLPAVSKVTVDDNQPFPTVGVLTITAS